MNINLANMIDHVTWDLGHAPCSGALVSIMTPALILIRLQWYCQITTLHQHSPLSNCMQLALCLFARREIKISVSISFLQNLEYLVPIFRCQTYFIVGFSSGGFFKFLILNSQQINLNIVFGSAHCSLQTSHSYLKIN